MSVEVYSILLFLMNLYVSFIEEVLQLIQDVFIYHNLKNLYSAPILEIEDDQIMIT